VEAILDHISVYHFLIGLSDFIDLFFHLIIKDLVHKSNALDIALSLSIVFLALDSLDQEHLQG
jgi:hypothetical protein